tara:strand:- start:1229 stop:2068 length:840 start_codon:yes stop_codon:yes gene_type:complete
MRFHSIGTDNLRIGVSTKMASGALDSMVHTAHLIRRYHTYEDNIKYVVLIRDAMDKYKAGYKQDLLEKVDNDPWPDSESGYYPLDPKPIFKSFFHRIFVTTKVESFESNNEKIRWGIDQIVNAHEFRGDSSYRWLKEEHMLFKIWNQWQNDVSWTLMNLGELKNIYFLELKDLSNPKFLEWLQEKDEKWKEYRGYRVGGNPLSIRSGIPQINKTDNYFWTNMDLFWKEYTEGKIAKGVLLNSPFYPTENTEIKDILKDIELEQEIIDNIRENNERYIRL